MATSKNASKPMNTNKNDDVTLLAESLWALENHEKLQDMEDQDGDFRKSRSTYLQRARLLLLKIENRGGKVLFGS